MLVAGVFTVSGIIDAFLYHGHKQLKAKLGKNTWVEYMLELRNFVFIELPSERQGILEWVVFSIQNFRALDGGIILHL